MTVDTAEARVVVVDRIAVDGIAVDRREGDEGALVS